MLRDVYRGSGYSASPILPGLEIGDPNSRRGFCWRPHLNSNSSGRTALMKRSRESMGQGFKQTYQEQFAVLRPGAKDELDNKPSTQPSPRLPFSGYEPFVDEEVIAKFLNITSRRVLEMARACEIPAHAIGKGSRNTWRFRISEIDAHFAAKRKPARAVPSAVAVVTPRKQ
jgi:hypothetical protein